MSCGNSETYYSGFGSCTYNIICGGPRKSFRQEIQSLYLGLYWAKFSLIESASFVVDEIRSLLNCKIRDGSFTDAQLLSPVAIDPVVAPLRPQPGVAGGNIALRRDVCDCSRGYRTITGNFNVFFTNELVIKTPPINGNGYWIFSLDPIVRNDITYTSSTLQQATATVAYIN